MYHQPLRAKSPALRDASVNHNTVPASGDRAFSVKTPKCRVCGNLVGGLCSCRTASDPQLEGRRRLQALEQSTEFAKVKRRRLQEELFKEEADGRDHLAREAGRALDSIVSRSSWKIRELHLVSQESAARSQTYAEVRESIWCLNSVQQAIHAAGELYAAEAEHRRALWINFLSFHHATSHWAARLHQHAQINAGEATERRAVSAQEVHARDRITDSAANALARGRDDILTRMNHAHSALSLHMDLGRRLLDGHESNLESLQKFATFVGSFDVLRTETAETCYSSRRAICAEEHGVRDDLFAWHRSEQSAILQRLEWIDGLIGDLEEAEASRRAALYTAFDAALHGLHQEMRADYHSIQEALKHRIRECNDFVTDTTQIMVGLAIKETHARADIAAQQQRDIQGRQQWSRAKQRQRDSAFAIVLSRREHVTSAESLERHMLLKKFSVMAEAIEAARMEHEIRIQELSSAEWSGRRDVFTSFNESLGRLREAMTTSEDGVIALLNAKYRARSAFEADEIADRGAVVSAELDARSKVISKLRDVEEEWRRFVDSRRAERVDFVNDYWLSRQCVCDAEAAQWDVLAERYRDGSVVACQRKIMRERREVANRCDELREAWLTAECDERASMMQVFVATCNSIRAKERQIFIESLKRFSQFEAEDRDQIFSEETSLRVLVESHFYDDIAIVRQIVLQRELEERLARQEMMREDDRGLYERFGTEPLPTDDLVEGRRSSFYDFTAATRLSGVFSTMRATQEEYLITLGMAPEEVASLSDEWLAAAVRVLSKMQTEERSMREQQGSLQKQRDRDARLASDLKKQLMHEQECATRHQKVARERREAIKNERNAHKLKTEQLRSSLKKIQDDVLETQRRTKEVKAQIEDIRIAVRDRSLQSVATMRSAAAGPKPNPSSQQQKPGVRR